jgi:hypothetical protein
MAIYGFDFYGTALYGRAPVVEFDASPVLAMPLGYGGLRVTWGTPSGEWDRLRVVRNSYGSPDFATDGEVLFDEAAEDAGIAEILDTSLLPGRFYYYSVFARSTETFNWVRAGTAFGLTIADFGYAGRMFDMVPLWVQEQDRDNNRTLERFLELFGIAADYVRSEVESLRWTRRPDLISGNLLMLLAEQFGVPQEPALGMRRLRIWTQNAAFLARTKGTLPGVQAFVSSLSGYDVDILYGPNLLKGTDSAAWFEYSGTVEDELTLSSIPDADITLEVTGSPWEISTVPESLNEVPYHAIPVRDDVVYSQTFRAKSLSGTVDVNVSFDWFDQEGALLSSDTSLQAEVSTDWVRFDFEATAPSGTAYVAIRAEGDGPAHLRRISLQRGDPYSGWAAGKSLDIRLLPNRTNLVTNPSFVLGLTTWSATSGAIARIEGDARHGNTYLAATGETVVQAGPYPIANGALNYVGSAFIQGSGRARLLWFGVGNNLIATGSWGTLGESEQWHQISAFGCCEPDATSITLEFELADGTKLDGAMLEQADSPGSYFDGSFFGADYIWSNMPHASSSRYFPARTVRNDRLRAILPDYLPLNQKYTLIYIDPAAVAYDVGDNAIGIGLLGTMDLGD